VLKLRPTLERTASIAAPTFIRIRVSPAKAGINSDRAIAENLTGAWLPCRQSSALQWPAQGLYVIDPATPPASEMRVIETADDRDKIFSLYRNSRKELRKGRLQIPCRVPPFSGHNLHVSNSPGSTLFMPVCDASSSLIGLIA
jgi:hypothetical protein